MNQDINTLKHIIAHETYHGIQQDLAETVCRDRREQSEPNNARWIAEGAADYVARILAKLEDKRRTAATRMAPIAAAN